MDNYDDFLSEVLRNAPQPPDDAEIDEEDIHQLRTDPWWIMAMALKEKENLDTIEAFDIVRDYIIRNSLNIKIWKYHAVEPAPEKTKPVKNKRWWQIW